MSIQPLDQIILMQRFILISYLNSYSIIKFMGLDSFKATKWFFHGYNSVWSFSHLCFLLKILFFVVNNALFTSEWSVDFPLHLILDTKKMITVCGDVSSHCTAWIDIILCVCTHVYMCSCGCAHVHAVAQRSTLDVFLSHTPPLRQFLTEPWAHQFG